MGSSVKLASLNPVNDDISREIGIDWDVIIDVLPPPELAHRGYNIAYDFAKDALRNKETRSGLPGGLSYILPFRVAWAVIWQEIDMIQRVSRHMNMAI